jgi:hypothetical protein
VEYPFRVMDDFVEIVVFTVNYCLFLLAVGLEFCFVLLSFVTWIKKTEQKIVSNLFYWGLNSDCVKYYWRQIKHSIHILIE